ncbi:hypothetical protein NDU88_000708 [Pleurodeles waltl]|uniref:Uncharacterized protein n=1 Tax=Pleurodeles waltl TaxID=8319 RepID=A0AAV7P1N8_PLEWA|nr:hypothetical protein NDU88_000708 [Pleurodeles waltl]
MGDRIILLTVCTPLTTGRHHGLRACRALGPHHPSASTRLFSWRESTSRAPCSSQVAAGREAPPGIRSRWRSPTRCLPNRSSLAASLRPDLLPKPSPPASPVMTHTTPLQSAPGESLLRELASLSQSGAAGLPQSSRPRTSAGCHVPSATMVTMGGVLGCLGTALRDT